MSERSDAELIDAIADRAFKLYQQFGVDDVHRNFILTSITTVHERILPLRLRELLDADDGNFAHDVAGIVRHLSLVPAPKLKDCFYPRFAL